MCCNKDSKCCIGFAVLLSFSILGVSYSIMTLPELLHVSFPVNEFFLESRPITENKTFAKVGLFKTEYDPSDLTESDFSMAILIEQDSKNYKTTKFPYLFPAQANAVGTLISVDEDLRSTLSLVSEEASASYQEAISELSEMGFSSCGEYMVDIRIALENLLNIFPELMPGIADTLYSTEDLADSFERVVADITGTQSPLRLLYIQELSAAVSSVIDLDCTVLLDGADLNTTLTSVEYECLAQSYIDILGDILTGVFQSWPDICDGETIERCFTLTGGSVVSGSLITDSATDLFQDADICALTASCSNKLEYMELLVNVTSANISDLQRDVQTLKSVYFEFREDGLTDSEISAEIRNANSNTDLPFSMYTPYTPCKALYAFYTIDNPNSTYFYDIDTCGVLEFSRQAAVIALEQESPISDIFAIVTSMYSTCRTITSILDAPIDFPISQCHHIQGGSAIFLTYQLQINIDKNLDILRDTPAAYNELRAFCEEDQSDVNTLEATQLYVILSTVGFGVVFILGIVSLWRKPIRLSMMISTGVISALWTNLFFISMTNLLDMEMFKRIDEQRIVPGTVFVSAGVIPFMVIVIQSLGSFVTLIYFGQAIAIYCNCNCKRNSNVTLVVLQQQQQQQQQPDPPASPRVQLQMTSVEYHVTQTTPAVQDANIPLATMAETEPSIGVPAQADENLKAAF